MAMADTIPVNTSVKAILAEYESLQAEADRLFQDYARTHSLKITCGPACSECCPYDVSVHFIEAYYLRMGMQALEPQTRHTVRLRALRNISKIERLEGFAGAIEKKSGGVVQDARAHLRYLLRGEVRCPFVGEQGGCLVYGYRPLICRLFGIPLKIWDAKEEATWCKINTPTPEALPWLNAYKLREEVDELSRTLGFLLTGQRQPERPIWFATLFPLKRLIEGGKVYTEDKSYPEDLRPEACRRQGKSIRQRLLKLGVYSTPAIVTIPATEEAYR